jgi:DNA-binding beta-propeller fold protein YncE
MKLPLQEVTRLAAALLAVAGPGQLVLAAESNPPVSSYHVLAHYDIGGAEKGYDYLKVDSDARRVFVAHGSRVEVLDADTGKHLGAIEHLSGAHGIEIVESIHRAFATSGTDRTVVEFDPANLQVVKTIKYFGAKPDALEFDSASGHLFVVNGGATGDITVVDPATGAIVNTVEIGGGKLEEITFDGAGRGFVNDEEKGVIHVFDSKTLKNLATWPLAPAEEPTGLAIDREKHRLFASCGNGMLAILDSTNGHLLGTAPIGPDPDGAAFDRKTGRVFTSNHDGTMSIVGEREPGKFVLLQTVTTAPGARTIALDEKTGHLYLPSGKFGPAPAPTQAAPEPRPPLIPESFGVVVVGP